MHYYSQSGGSWLLIIFLFCFVSSVIGALLALIPATIAKNKGYSFGLWWFYGWMLFVVALIHVSLIPDKNVQQTPFNVTPHVPYPPQSANMLSAVDELKKYKELMDQGIITEAEFQGKKEQLLKLM